MTDEKIMIAMSGGVDSAAAALIISDSGTDCAGVTMKLWSPNERITDDCAGSDTPDIRDARKIAELLEIPHYVIPLGDTFRRCVIEPFINEYRRGGTPNPCVECNRCLKFGKLLDFADSLGYGKVATGHYSKIERTPSGRYIVRCAADETKDQSYVLWSLTQNQLSHIVFPLGDLHKSDIRELSAKRGFVNAHKSDSQDICFIPDGDYAGFIVRTSGKCFPSGNFVDIGGNVLGSHKGIIHYTVGQRKGLGIALGRPVFVKEKNPLNNTITLCDDRELYSSTLTARNANFIALDSISSSLRVTAKIRYKHSPAPAVVTQTSDSTFSLTFDEPQRAIAPGQSVVLYDGDILIGGGVID